MMHKIKMGLLKRLRFKESWVIFFILGLVMLNYPFIQIFNKTYAVSGIPLLFIYCIAGWAISIVIIYLFTRALDLHEDDDSKGDRR